MDLGVSDGQIGLMILFGCPISARVLEKIGPELFVVIASKIS